MGIGLGILLVFFMRDLAIPGLPTLHDSNPHISRAIAYHTALLDGQFPPMWAKEVLGGIGSPVMMLNYQLPYMLGEIWHRAGLNYFDSYKFSLGLSFVLSGVFMYIALASKFSPVAAWVGALIYTLAPYRYVDIYVRGALGESLTFIFPPLLIWGFARSSMPLLIIGWAGLFLTHPTASAAFSAFFLGYTFFVGKREEIVKRLKLFFGSFAVALLIAAFNLLPTLTLTKYTYYSPELSDTLLMFPSLTQLLHSPWGYGVSLPGTNDGMSFELGIMQWAVLVFGSIYVWKKRNTEMIYLLSASLVCLFFILPVSIPVYKILHLTNYIDFPWRLIFCLVFASAWTGAILIHQLQQKVSSRAKSRDPSTLVGMTAAIIVILLIVQTFPIAHTDKYWNKTAAWFARETGDSYGEYAPRTRSTRDSAPFWKRAEFVKGEGKITTLIEKSNEQKYQINTTTENGEVRINTAFFPGWVIPADCQISSRTLSHIDDSGLILCQVSKGESILEIKFEAPTVQRVGSMLTLAGIGVYLWISFLSYYPHSTKKTR